jgi:glycolate oxidase
LARANLDQDNWDYLTGGSESETTLMRNRQAIDSIAFRPRVMRDVTTIDPSVELLGMKMRLPLFLAPIGSLQRLVDGGAETTSKAAHEFGIPACISSVTQPGIKELRELTTGDLMFQLYVRDDMDWILGFVDQAVDLGYKGFCLSADTANYGRRERDKIKKFEPRGARTAKDTDGFVYQAALNWDVVNKIKKHADIPIMVKGIATAEDAKLAVEHGVEVIYISNHGGRQLDHGRGAIDVLPEVVDAADGKAKVIIDGGFCRGTDIAKAIALGADAVGMGKMYCMCAAAAGQDGVLRMLELLEEEFLLTMALLGVNQLSDLNPDYLHPAEPVRFGHISSAFPHFEFEKYDY